MRALVFWEGVYRYGGLPIIHRRINPSEDGKLPRNTFSDCVDSILVDCDRAASILPDYYTKFDIGGTGKQDSCLSPQIQSTPVCGESFVQYDDPYFL